MPQDGSYHVKITGAGVTIVRDIDKATLDRVALVLFGGTPGAVAQQYGVLPDAPMASAQVPVEMAPAQKSQLSSTVRGALNQFNARVMTQKLAVIAFFNKEAQSKKSVSYSDFQEGLRDAAEPLPANLSRDILSAIRLNWLAREKGNKAYYLTTEGEQQVLGRFSSVPKRGGGAKRKGNHASKKA
jgi:hypothetical protein